MLALPRLWCTLRPAKCVALGMSMSQPRLEQEFTPRQARLIALENQGLYGLILGLIQLLCVVVLAFVIVYRRKTPRVSRYTVKRPMFKIPS